MAAAPSCLLFITMTFLNAKFLATAAPSSPILYYSRQGSSSNNYVPVQFSYIDVSGRLVDGEIREDKHCSEAAWAYFENRSSRYLDRLVHCLTSGEQQQQLQHLEAGSSVGGAAFSVGLIPKSDCVSGEYSYKLRKCLEQNNRFIGVG